VVARLPLGGAFPARGLGSVKVDVLAVGVSDASANEDAPCEPFVVADSGGRVILDLDRTWALGAVATVLGTEVPVSPRPLSPGERGVAGALAAAALSRLGLVAPLQLSPLAGVAREAGTPFMDLSLVIQHPAARVGRLRLWNSHMLPGAGVHPSRAARIPVLATLELARTMVTRASLASVGRGDALVFEGHPPAGPSHGVTLGVGPFAAAARLDGQGTLTLRGPLTTRPSRSVALSRTASETIESRAAKEKRMSEASASPPSDAMMSITAALAVAPVEVVAEVGRITLRGEELAGLCAGAVLSLGKPLAQGITLSVAGAVVARGLLVDVDGTLAVQVTEVVLT
jgi:type III secretion system YscQ/HrcQ family protein